MSRIGCRNFHWILNPRHNKHDKSLHWPVLNIFSSPTLWVIKLNSGSCKFYFRHLWKRKRQQLKHCIVSREGRRQVTTETFWWGGKLRLPLDLVLDNVKAEFDELIKARMLTRRVIVKKEIFAQCVIIIRQTEAT